MQITYPDELLTLTQLSQAQFEHLAHEALLVRLYGLGVVSTGKAAELLNISRREFLERLGAYGVSEFDDDLDLEA